MAIFSGQGWCRTDCPEVQTLPGKKVDVGGYGLYCILEGGNRESPSVVLISGKGEDLHAWDAVRPEIAGFTKVLAYNRAGLGRCDEQSDADPRESRDLDRVARELHSLIRAVEIRGKLVLVAHSMGGFLPGPAPDLPECGENRKRLPGKRPAGGGTTAGQVPTVCHGRGHSRHDLRV